MLKNYDDLIEIVSSKSNKTQIVDARASTSFYGKSFLVDTRPLNGLFQVQMLVIFLELWTFRTPMCSISRLNHWNRSMNFGNVRCEGNSSSLTRIDRLVFQENGVDVKKQTIYTCQTGTTASTLAFVGHLLGQNSTPVYNVSSKNEKIDARILVKHCFYSSIRCLTRERVRD